MFFFLNFLLVKKKHGKSFLKRVLKMGVLKEPPNIPKNFLGILLVKGGNGLAFEKSSRVSGFKPQSPIVKILFLFGVF